MKRQRIDGIVTHLRPHADEELALLQLDEYGDEVYYFAPGCRLHYAPGYLDPNDFTVYGRNFLRLGTGGGYLDDHGRGNEDRRACCQLVAAHLGISNKPELIKLIEAVARLDKNLSKTKAMTLPRLMKMAYRYGRTPEEVRDWVRCAFDALIAKEKQFFEEVRADNRHIRDDKKRAEANRTQFLKEKRPWENLVIDTIAPFIPQEDRRAWLDFVDKVEVCQKRTFARAAEFARANVKRYYSQTFGRHFTMLSVDAMGEDEQSLHLELDPASRSNCDFLILRHLGRTMIVANRTAFMEGASDATDSKRLDLWMFIGCLRQAEATKRGQETSGTNLLVQGTVPGLVHWHVQEYTSGTWRITNRTETHPDVEQTALTFKRIEEIFKDVLGLTEPKARAHRKKDPSAA